MKDYTTASLQDETLDKKEYLSEGSIVVKNLLSKDVLSQVISDIHLIFKKKFETEGFKYETASEGEIKDQDLFDFFAKKQEAYIGCMKAIQNLPEIYKIGISPKILSLLHQIGLEFPSFIQKPIVMLNSRKTSTKVGNWKTPAHQDWRSIQGSLNLAIVWIALRDVPKELGPVEIIPKSHNLGLLPSEDDDWYMHVNEDSIRNKQFTPIPVNAGDAIIFSGFMVHRGGVNKSEKIRYSLQFRYNDLFEPTYVKRDFPNPYSSTPPKEIITKNFPTKSDIKKIFDY